MELAIIKKNKINKKILIVKDALEGFEKRFGV